CPPGDRWAAATERGPPAPRPRWPARAPTRSGRSPPKADTGSWPGSRPRPNRSSGAGPWRARRAVERLDWGRGKRGRVEGLGGRLWTATTLRSLRPFAPAVSVEPVRLETAPEGGPADAQVLGRLRELPVVRVERLDDSLLFPRRQRRWALDAGNEH